MHSLQHAMRRLRRQPGFSLLAVLTLALGFGALTAIFAVVDAVLLRPLPYPEPDRLVAIEHAAPGLDLFFLEMSIPLYLHYREHSTNFSAIGLYSDGPAAISGLDRPMQVDGAMVTPSTLEMLGVRPVQGRLFIEEESVPGAVPSVLVSEGFWRRQLGADPDVLERSLQVDGVTSRIVGVLPTSFTFPSLIVEIWRPQIIDPAVATLGAFGPASLARLADGATLETARVELRHLLGDPRNTFPQDHLALTSGLDAFLFGIAPHDLTTFAGVPILLLLIVVLACFAPAKRAADVDPMRALRSE